MKDKLYDNADSFAMSFDEEWENVDCDDTRLKIDKVLDLLSDHPFLIYNYFKIFLKLFILKLILIT